MAGRTRVIAIVAGAITITAIVLAFASSYLGLSWLWLRPAAELLLLAELVGLIVLERHQLFEPVHEKVDDIKAGMSDLQRTIGALTERMSDSGQVAIHSHLADFTRQVARAAREALGREQTTLQTLRTALLTGIVFPQDTRDAAAELLEVTQTFAGFLRSEQGPADSRTRLWMMRVAWFVSSTEAFNSSLQYLGASFFAQKPLNLEVKIAVRANAEALLSPGLITDREVALVYGNRQGEQAWGLILNGPQFVSIFSRWFDDLWAAIPDTRLVYSRKGVNQPAIDDIRNELEGARLRENAPRSL